LNNFISLLALPSKAGESRLELILFRFVGFRRRSFSSLQRADSDRCSSSLCVHLCLSG
jgi:hypothetical protein